VYSSTSSPGRHAAECERPGRAELLGDVEERCGEFVVTRVRAGLVIAGQHEQVGAVGLDRVELRAGQLGDAVAVDAHLRRELGGVHAAD